MEISVQDATMEMDASLKEYQAALDAQFEERKAMILSQEEKDLAVEVVVRRLRLHHDHSALPWISGHHAEAVLLVTEWAVEYSISMAEW